MSESERPPVSRDVLDVTGLADEMRAALDASERPPVDPLREALTTIAGWDAHTDDCAQITDKRSACGCGWSEIADYARAALASPAVPRPEGLDVERLACPSCGMSALYCGLGYGATLGGGVHRCCRKCEHPARLSDTGDTES